MRRHSVMLYFCANGEWSMVKQHRPTILYFIFGANW